LKLILAQSASVFLQKLILQQSPKVKRNSDSCKPPLLYFFHHDTSFIDIDETIMRQEYVVKKCDFQIRSAPGIPLLMLRQIRFILNNRSSAAMVCMFAGYHTLVPVLLGKLFRIPVLIIAGGIDGVSLPEIRYGNFRKPLLGRITAWSFRNCTHIAPISEYLVESEYRYFDSMNRKQGIRSFVKDLKTPVSVIHNGFKTEKWNLAEPEQRGLSFLSIAANLDDEVRIKVKGIDLVLELAKRLPEANFTIIGKDAPEGFAVPQNVEILPFQPQEKLKQLYQRHRFYLQLSMSEGFGNTLAEAMLCGCIPIGSAAGAIPMVIGEPDLILPKKDIGALLELIKKVGERDDLGSLRIRLRERVLNHFSLERRQKALLHLIKSIRTRL
jgi:glycosyltransferase involved in cell wall biosynthesis